MNFQHIIAIAALIFVAVILFLTLKTSKKEQIDFKTQDDRFSPDFGDSTSKKTKHKASSSSSRRNRNDNGHDPLTSAVILDEMTSTRSYGDSDHGSSSSHSDSSSSGSSISSGGGFSGGGDSGGGGF